MNEAPPAIPSDPALDNNRPGAEIVNHFTYGIVSDGDLIEGVSSEAAFLAGHLKLGKLIYLYDDDHVTLSAGTDITFTEDRALELIQGMVRLPA